MIKAIQKLKNRKGFTLVELIVVLVILAILAAMLVPALTGYIDKAREQNLRSEAELVLTAAQVTVSEQYANGNIEVTNSTADFADGAKLGDYKDQINQLGEVKSAGTWSFTIGVANESGYKKIFVQDLKYSDSKNVITYNATTGWASTTSGTTGTDLAGADLTSSSSNPS